MKKHADIIDNYADLPVGLYLDLVEIYRSDLPELDKQVRIIAGLTGYSETEVLALPIDTYKRYAEKTVFLQEPCNEGRIASTYKAGAFDLVPTSDLAKITAAQYIDFQTLSKEGESKTVELLSVFLIPRGHKYADGYDIAEVQQAIRRDLSVRDVITLAAFFFRKYAESIVSSLTSCKREIRRMKDPARKAELEARMEEIQEALDRLADLPSAGDGSPTSTS